MGLEIKSLKPYLTSVSRLLPSFALEISWLPWPRVVDRCSRLSPTSEEEAKADKAVSERPAPATSESGEAEGGGGKLGGKRAPIQWPALGPQRIPKRDVSAVAPAELAAPASEDKPPQAPQRPQAPAGLMKAAAAAAASAIAASGSISPIRPPGALQLDQQQEQQLLQQQQQQQQQQQGNKPGVVTTSVTAAPGGLRGRGTGGRAPWGRGEGSRGGRRG